MIEMRDFSAGWIPSDDSYNGRKNGMLQMDNLCLDEIGALTLVRGTSNQSAALADLSYSLYSRYIGSDLYRYAAIGDGSIRRDKNKAGTFGTTVLSGGAIRRADFAAALGQVFMVSGSKKVKDNGTTQANIGIAAPTTPSVAIYGTPSQIDLQNLDGSSQFTNWTVDQGVLTYNNANGDMRFQTDAATFQAVIRTVFSAPIDLSTYASGGGWSSVGYQLLTDVIQFYVSIPDATQLQSVSLRLLSFDPGSTPSTAAPAGSYYDYTWNYNDANSPFSSNLWNLLFANIKDFNQKGDTAQSFWNSIKAITVTFVAASQISLGFTEINQQGSSRAALCGDYQYYTQNVADTGTYQAVSAISTASNKVHVENGAVTLTLTPPVDSQTTSVNVYRLEVNTQAVPTLLANIAKASTSYQDGLSDTSLLAGSGTTANFFLKSVQDIPSDILQIVGLYFGRMLYFTSSNLVFSDYLNPDAYDSRYVLGYSGNAAELFLWSKKVGNSVVYIGTNYDIYQLSGTLAILPDGTLDATIRPLGVQYPPVSQAVAAESGSVIYMANDGWRLLSVYGDDSQNLSSNLDLLFKGYARYNQLAFVPGYDNSSIARCSLNKGKFYTIVTLSSGDSQILVFDITKRYWYTILRDPFCLFTEEDGTLLIGDSDSIVKILDTTGNYLSSGVTAQKVNILTPIFDGGTPRQRKDCFTLKIRCDTGGSSLALSIIQDGTTIGLGTISANGDTEIVIDASAFTLGKAYQFNITGYALFFKLYYITLDYVDRPEQLTRLRLTPSNLNSSGKKRMFTCPPMAIDTLGHTVTFTPELDGSFSTHVSNPTIVSNEKTTYVPTFATEVIATDIGGLLTGGPFEFYGQFVDDWIVEKIPTGRLVDQIGPFEALRLAFLERFRYRCICDGTLINYTVYVEDVAMYTSSFTTIANVDKTYEIVLPKGLNGSTFRIVFTSTFQIHRYTAKVKLRITGGQTEGKWVG